jgi:hypothetical protein
MHPNLKFTAETETNNKINYLDLTIQRTATCWKTSIYRKQTFTDTIIPYSSNHPTQHKYAAIKFLYNRLNTYNLQENKYKTEENTICNIMQNNDFPIRPYHPPPPRKTTIAPDERMTTTIQKWATFTYVGKETTFITNLFKKTDVGIALRTNNTIQRLLVQSQQTSDKYTQSGVYKLTYPDCNKAYVGQTGRNFTVRFNEHKNAFKTNSHTSNFAKHLIEQAHSALFKTQCKYCNDIAKGHISTLYSGITFTQNSPKTII